MNELMGLVKSLSAQLERLKYGKSTEDFPAHEEDVLDNPIKDDEYFMIVGAHLSAPEVSVVPSFYDYSEDEQSSPTSQFVD